MNKREVEIERKLVAMVERHGGLCLKWVCPGWSGVPDRLVLIKGKGARPSRVIFVELKRPKGSQTRALQEWWAKRLTDLGFDHWFIKDEETLEAFRRFYFRG